MDIILKNILVFDSSSSWHKKTVDLQIEDGIIKAIGNHLTGPNQWHKPNAIVSKGFIDMRVALNDPGLEYKETLEQLEKSAAKGGFCKVLTMPNTQPVVQSKEAISYIKSRSKFVTFLPTAAVSKNTEGVDFTEMIDLANAGAMAFTDGDKPIYNADLLLKSLQYLAPINKLLINKPEDKHLALYGQVHEGLTSTLMGLKGIPALAEEIMIDRDLKLLAYVQSAMPDVKLHFSCISTTKAIDQIRIAKKAGLNITADTAAHYLMFTDENVQGFDTNFKTSPPFRTKKDRETIIAAVLDGTIDVVTSDHRPQDADAKNLEFDHAEFGVVGLETVFIALNTLEISLEKIEALLINRPREILNIENQSIEIGAEACLSVFGIDSIQEIDTNWLKSPSKNSPFLNSTLKGNVYGIINRGHSTLV